MFRALLACVLLLLAACPHRVDFGPQGRIDDPGVLLRAVRERYLAVHGLVGRGKVTADTPEGDGNLQMAIEVSEPGKIYLETADFFGTPRGIFVTDGATFVFYRPDENTWVEAPATAERIGAYLPLPLPPAELVSALLAEPPIVEPEDARVEVDERSDAYVLTLREGGVRQRVRIGTRDLRLLSVETRGAPQYDAFFEDYREIDGVVFPTTVLLKVPRARSEVRLRYTSIRLNQDSAPEIFRLDPPPGAEVIRDP